LYGAGRILADDPGTANYGVPIQEGWYKTTLAHNTLVVDQANQRAATGKLLAFSEDSGAGVPAVLADAGPIYEGVTFRRAAFLLPGGTAAFLDVVRAADGKERTLDLALHSPGAAAAPPAGFSPATAGEIPGYSYLRDLRSLNVTGPLSTALADGESGATRVALAPLDGLALTCMVGTGVGRNTEDRVPALIARRRGAGLVLGWALAPGAIAPAVEAVAATGADGKPVGTAAAARIRHGGATYLIVSNPDGVPMKAGRWSGSDKLAAVKE
jgi:hypothetical protein